MALHADRRWWRLILLLALVLTPGCQAIAGIFKAGFWSGIIIAAIVVGLIVWLMVGRRSA